MAASMPFDPFWKFVLNEDSDGEEYVDERRRKDETIVKKVRFKLPRHEPAATDDSMSLMKFVSMDLGPQEPEPEKRSFFRKDTKDTRDDDDSWSLLNASFTDENKERGARRRGKEKREETVKSHGCLTPAPDDSKSTGGNGRGNSILRRGSIRNSEKSSFRSLFKKGPIFPDEGDTEEKPGDSMSSFLPTNLLSSSQPPPEHKTKALAKQEAKAKPTTKARIERITVTQTNVARKQSDSQAVAGIAAAGATTTSELFEAQPAPKSRRALPVDQDIEKRKTMDFWDMFSASDDDDDTDDGSFSGSSYASDGTEESESTNTDVVIQSQFVIQSQVRETLSEKDDSPRSISGTADALLENHPSKSGDAVAQNDDQSLVDEWHDQLPSKKGIGRIVCCSVKDLNGRQDFFDRGVSNRTCGQRSRYVQPDVPLYPLYPGVKMVGDEDTNNVVVTSGKVNRWHESHTAFPPDVIESSKGPQSLYAYDYDSRTYMGAQYETYGSRSVINIQNEAPFQTHKREKGEVTVQIEASTISYSDCRIRKGQWWGESQPSLPLIPGVDFVGKVDGIDKRTASRFSLHNGDRVMALVKYGGNARFTKIRADQLVKVPDDVEPSEAACLAEAYLSAFQAVHYGQRQLTRYKKGALSGKSILVLGVLTNVGRAVVELANAAGATLVYAPCKAKHRDKVRALCATPLGLEKKEWMPLLHQKLDLIVDATAEIKGDVENYFSALSENGDYLLVGRTQEKLAKIMARWAGSPKLVCGSNKARMGNQLHSYDVYANWESNLESCKRDLAHLIKLLQTRIIAPRVLDRIPLNKVAKAQEVLDENRMQGYLVCEPWIKNTSRAVFL